MLLKLKFLDNLLTNPKSSYYIKSKSHKSHKSSRDKSNKSSKDKSNKSSFLTSINQNKSKSNLFSKKLPNANSANSNSVSHNILQKTINRSYDQNQKSQESFMPSIYFSLNNVPMVDSPISAGRSLHSFKTRTKNKRETKIIKRNLFIYSVVNQKKENHWPQESPFLNVNESQGGKIFTNKQNQILKDLIFFEEGLNPKKPQKTFKIVWKNLKESILRILFSPFILLFHNNLKIKIEKIMKICLEERNLIWDFTILTLLGFYYLWIPIDLAFTFSNEGIPLFVVTGLVFLISSFIKLKKIENPQKTHFLEEYMKIHVFYDLTTVIILALFLVSSYLSLRPLWGLAFLTLKLPEAIEIIYRIKARTSLWSSIDFWFTIFLMFFRIFCFANITACIWIYLGMNYKENDINWLSNDNRDYSQFELYFRSLSASFANITLVGLGMSQGLIIPINTLEYAFNCLVTALGFMFLWYNWKCFSKIMTNETQEQNKNLKEFEIILRNYGLEYDERTNFRKELELVLNKNKEQRLFGELLKLMSPSLQESVLMKIYWPIIKKIPVLSRNFSKKFLIKLLHKIKILTISPNETLFKVKK